MSAWWGAAGVLMAYNAVAQRRGKPYACEHVRALSPGDKTLAVAAWAWLGWHVFVKKGTPHV